MEKPKFETTSTEMVRIPAGKFQMGSKERTAVPLHTVYVDEFWIDIYEVTNAQFKAFIDANPQWNKDNIPGEYHNGDYLKLWNENDYPNGKANHPVVYVSWYAAMAYAKWTGKRLLTEWATSIPGHIADRGRDAPTNTNGWLGFRCAKTITVPEKDKSVRQSPTKLLGTTVLLEMEYADENIESFGSGFFVTPDKIVTNIHVLAGAKKVTAKQVSTGKDYTIEGIIAFDDKNDLAVLKILEEGLSL